MPRRRAGVPYASGQFTRSRVFIDTRGQPTLGIAICSRCQCKDVLANLIDDGNLPGFKVHRPEISPGCFDTRDPFRDPAPPPDRLQLPFTRPDVPLTVPAATAAQLPLQPPDDE